MILFQNWYYLIWGLDIVSDVFEIRCVYMYDSMNEHVQLCVCLVFICTLELLPLTCEQAFPKKIKASMKMRWEVEDATHFFLFSVFPFSFVYGSMLSVA